MNLPSRGLLVFIWKKILEKYNNNNNKIQKENVKSVQCIWECVSVSWWLVGSFANVSEGMCCRWWYMRMFYWSVCYVRVGILFNHFVYCCEIVIKRKVCHKKGKKFKMYSPKKMHNTYIHIMYVNLIMN